MEKDNEGLLNYFEFQRIKTKNPVKKFLGTKKP